MKKENNKKSGRITIDKLAIMMNNGFEGMEKRITSVIKEEIAGVKNQISGVNNRIDDISMNRIKYEDHDKLKARVSFIERKLEIKS